MKVLSMCSSLQRADVLYRMIKSWEAATHSPDARLVIYVSKNDPSLNGYQGIPLPSRVSIEYGPKKTMVEVLNYFSCEKYKDYDYYQEVNDDHVYVTDGWEIKMAEAVDRKNNGYSIAYGQTRQFPTATMHGAKLVHGLGYFFPPEYAHTYVDLWLMDMGFEADVITFIPEVMIDHVHPTFGRAAWDKVYMDGNDETHFSRKIYETWCATRKAADIQMVKDMVRKEKTCTNLTLPKIDEDVTVFMNTYDRIDLLQNAVLSYMLSNPRPKRLYVFDDKGTERDRIREIILRIPEAMFIENDKNYGSDGNILQAQRCMFEAGAKNLLMLDSDCLFAHDWWAKAQEIVASGILEKAVICLFNARVHPAHPYKIKGFVSKQYLGGLGLMLNKASWKKYVLPVEKGSHPGWDGQVCTAAKKDGKDVLACSPSKLQHTGFKRGVHAHIDNTECVADDFDGAPVEDLLKQEAKTLKNNPGIAYKHLVPPASKDLKHPILLRYLGSKTYRGSDDNGCKDVICNEMEFIYVSKAKAQQLLKDFSGMFCFISSLTGEEIW